MNDMQKQVRDLRYLVADAGIGVDALKVHIREDKPDLLMAQVNAQDIDDHLGALVYRLIELERDLETPSSKSTQPDLFWAILFRIVVIVVLLVAILSLLI